MEYASLRGYISILPAEKPYTNNYVVNQLKAILSCENLKDGEAEVYAQALERLRPSEKPEWYEFGGYTSQFDVENEFPVFFKINSELAERINCNSPQLSSEFWFGLNFGGNIKENFSYLFDFSFAIEKLAIAAFAPNSFYKNWDGFQFVINDYYLYESVAEETAIAIRMLPELVYSIYDDRYSVKFSRSRREWGYGSGSLWLSNNGGPFVALETKINPLPWLKTNFLFGSLEYENNASLKNVSNSFQNLYTIMSGEVNFNYFYAGILGSSVIVKRFEFGYLHPFQFPFMTQNNYGDFDNVQLGIYFGSVIPGIMQIYFNIFSDEMSFTEHFFHADRNMFCYNVGVKAPLPFFVSTLTAQYTKIEPYMYSHPLTQTPWYSQKMDSSYINHGDCLGSYLSPNSDEILVK
ncbi:MAG: hypothetical protein PUK48_05395, partial [Spirochaetales bacterium]|nr:hypothetical protein [Spirochaetales bacterium]